MKALAQSKLAKARAIVRLLDRHDVEPCDQVVKLINNLDVDGLKVHIKENRPLKDQTFDELRQRAAARRVYNYSRMGREELIEALHGITSEEDGGTSADVRTSERVEASNTQHAAPGAI